jgi:hypothetical protein
MLKIYKYCFYTRYLRWRRSSTWRNTAEYSSIFDLTLLTFLNFRTVVFLVSSYGFNYIPQFDKKELLIPVILILFILAIINYYSLIHKRKFQNIIEEFEKYSLSEIKSIRIWFFVYLILSVAIPIVGGYVYSRY